MSFDQLLSYVFKEINATDTPRITNGVCQLRVEEGLVVTLEHAPREQCVHLYTTVRATSESDRLALYETLLEAQLFGREMGDSMAFGLDRSAGEIVLCKKLSIQSITAEAFSESLSEFIAWGEHWLAKLSESEPSSASTPQSEMPHYFIRA